MIKLIKKKLGQSLSEAKDLASPSIILIQRVSSLAASAILTIIVRGIDSNIPTGPSTQPHKTKETNTTSGERFNPLPIQRGSTALPITKLTTTKPKRVRPALPKPN
jgi:hypothetical protein